MALTERAEQSLHILHNGMIEVRDTLVIERDGVEVSRSHHRKVIDVEDDVVIVVAVVVAVVAVAVVFVPLLRLFVRL